MAYYVPTAKVGSPAWVILPTFVIGDVRVYYERATEVPCKQKKKLTN